LDFGLKFLAFQICKNAFESASCSLKSAIAKAPIAPAEQL
jgi:hypothetical protein